VIFPRISFKSMAGGPDTVSFLHADHEKEQVPRLLASPPEAAERPKSTEATDQITTEKRGTETNGTWSARRRGALASRRSKRLQIDRRVFL